MLHLNTSSIAIDFAGFGFKRTRARIFECPPEGGRYANRIVSCAALAAL